MSGKVRRLVQKVDPKTGKLMFKKDGVTPIMVPYHEPDPYFFEVVTPLKSTLSGVDLSHLCDGSTDSKKREEEKK